MVSLEMSGRRQAVSGRAAGAVVAQHGERSIRNFRVEDGHEAMERSIYLGARRSSRR